MPTLTFQHTDKRVEADMGERLYDVAERAEGGIPFAREARTLTTLDLNPEIFRLACLPNVGRGDIVWGQPNNAPEDNQTLAARHGSAKHETGRRVRGGPYGPPLPSEPVW